MKVFSYLYAAIIICIPSATHPFISLPDVVGKVTEKIKETTETAYKQSGLYYGVKKGREAISSALSAPERAKSLREGAIQLEQAAYTTFPHALKKIQDIPTLIEKEGKPLVQAAIAQVHTALKEVNSQIAQVQAFNLTSLGFPELEQHIMSALLNLKEGLETLATLNAQGNCAIKGTERIAKRTQARAEKMADEFTKQFTQTANTVSTAFGGQPATLSIPTIAAPPTDVLCNLLSAFNGVSEIVKPAIKTLQAQIDELTRLITKENVVGRNLLQNMRAAADALDSI